jgi:hypothetical protein
MIEAAVTALESTRRRYRRARKLIAMRSASADARRQGLRVVHMIHVGKTGGTAVQQALVSAEQPPGVRLLLHTHWLTLLDLPIEDEVFFFLRDPVARFISSFEMRRREGRPRHYRAWTSGERRAFKRFESAQALALALRSTVRSERATAESAMTGIIHVRSHLADWLGDEKLVRARQKNISFVGWQERLDDDFRALVGLLGLPPTTSLPDDDYRANRSPSNTPFGALSPEAAEAIRTWYARDYRLIALLEELGLSTAPFHIPNRR